MAKSLDQSLTFKQIHCVPFHLLEKGKSLGNLVDCPKRRLKRLHHDGHLRVRIIPQSGQWISEGTV
jgi:hypothetical protein